MLRTFETDEELYKKFKEICLREGVNVGEKLNEFLKDYIKNHGEGNPIYALDKWQEPFIMTPAFGESMNKWRDHISKLKPNEVEEIMNKAESIKIFARNYL